MGKIQEKYGTLCFVSCFTWTRAYQFDYIHPPTERKKKKYLLCVVSYADAVAILLSLALCVCSTSN